MIVVGWKEASKTSILFAPGVDDGAVGADKYHVHLSQAADCCRAERSEQNKHLVYDEDNDVDDRVVDGDDDSVDNGDDDSVDDGADEGAEGWKEASKRSILFAPCVDDGAGGADKHLAHFSQAAN
eukprot:1588458-Ditylum_brightwellii.AAC.1